MNNFCSACGAGLVRDTNFCGSCGTVSAVPVQPPMVHVQVINAVSPQAVAPMIPEADGTYGLPIPSMIIGILSALTLLDQSTWDHETISGWAVIGIVGLVLGIVSVSRQKKGEGMAVTGMVLSAIGLLGLVDRMP